MDAERPRQREARPCRLIPARRRGPTRGAGWRKEETSVGKVHKVLHCRNSAGCRSAAEAPTWNRDCNASRNLVMLTVCEMQGLERPAAFLPRGRCPGANLSTRAKQPAAHPAAETTGYRVAAMKTPPRSEGEGMHVDGKKKNGLC